MNRFERWAVWTTSILTVATGVGYFVTKYLFTPSDPYAVVSHPWQPWFLKAHILVSPLLLFALGAVAVDHVWNHFVSGVRWGRRSALLTALAVVPMVVTGYLVQVLTGQGWVRAMALSHIGFGALYAAGLLVHTVVIRRGGPGGEASAGRGSAGTSSGAAPGSSAEGSAPGAQRRRPGASAGGAGDGGDGTGASGGADPRAADGHPRAERTPASPGRGPEAADGRSRAEGTPGRTASGRP